MAAQITIARYLKQIDPLTYIPLAGALFSVVGALLGWYTNRNDIAPTTFTQLIDTRAQIVLLISVVAIVVTFASYISRLYHLSIINILLGSFALVYTLKSRPDSIELSLLEITTGIGYWLCLLGLAALTFGSFAMLIAGAPPPRTTQVPKAKRSIVRKRKTRR